MSEELYSISIELMIARRDKAAAEKKIKTLQNRYFELLDKEVGHGQVEFTYEGYRFGRVIAEKPVFNIDAFRSEHPELSNLLLVKTTYSVDEEAMDAYLARHPEQQAVISQYVEVTPEARWKNPVPVKDE